MAKEDIQVLIDTYLYFFKGSEQEATTLILLADFAQQLIEKKDIENLKKLLICFEKTTYENDILGAISALEIEMGHPVSFTPPAAGAVSSTSPRHILYDEWQAARTNRDLETILRLSEEVVRQGLEQENVVKAVIESLLE